MGMRVFGVDPGSRMTGWAVVESRDGAFRRLESGVVSLPTRKGERAIARLLGLPGPLSEALAASGADLVAVEAGYVGHGGQSTIAIAAARGVVVALAGLRGLPIVEAAPAAVKRRVAGNGHATKEQVEEMLGLQVEGCRGHEWASADESDAAAVAYWALLEASHGA